MIYVSKLLKIVGADSRVGRLLPVFPMLVCNLNLSSLNSTGKSVNIFKAKGIAEIHIFHCMLAHIENQKTC